MTERINAYIEKQFSDAPNTKEVKDLKQEITTNTIDRYNDLISSGKSEQEAFDTAIESIGNINSLIESVCPDVAYQAMKKQQKRSSMFIASAVMLYILSIIPVILFSLISEAGAIVGVCIMFLLIGAATFMLVYNHNMNENVKDEFYANRYSNRHVIEGQEVQPQDNEKYYRNKDENRQLKRAVSGLIWSVGTVIYLAISFITMSWYITWLVFPITGAVSNISDAVIDLAKCGGENK